MTNTSACVLIAQPSQTAACRCPAFQHSSVDPAHVLRGQAWQDFVNFRLIDGPEIAHFLQPIKPNATLLAETGACLRRANRISRSCSELRGCLSSPKCWRSIGAKLHRP